MLSEHRSPNSKIDFSSLDNITVLGFLRMVSELCEDAGRLTLLNIPKNIYETIRVACRMSSNIEVATIEVEVFSKDSPNNSSSNRMMGVKELADLAQKGGGMAVLGDGKVVLGTVARLSPRMFDLTCSPLIKYENKVIASHASEISFWISYVEFLNHSLRVASNFAKAIYYSWLEMRNNSALRVDASIASLSLLGVSSSDKAKAGLNAIFKLAGSVETGVVAEIERRIEGITAIQRSLQSSTMDSAVDEARFKNILSNLTDESQNFASMAQDFLSLYDASSGFQVLENEMAHLKNSLLGALSACSDPREA